MTDTGKSELYDELDEKIIDALTVNPKMQWSYQQRRAVKALVLQKQIDVLSFMVTDQATYKSLKKQADVTILAQIDRHRAELVAVEYKENTPADTEREAQLYLIARWVAKHNNYAWSKMTDGEKREEIEFVQKQAPYKELLALIAGLKSV